MVSVQEVVKIKKVFSLILIMTFLYQNAAFCATGRSFTLRAPSHFSKSTEEFVKNQHNRENTSQRTIEFSNGQIDIENLGESETIFPITSFSDMNTLFPVTDLGPGIMEFIKSLEISGLSVALDDLVLNAIEHQFGASGAVNMKIEKFKGGEILRITIQQPSSSKDARDRLDINKEGFDLRGPDYLINVQERMESSAFIRRGNGFRVIGDLIRFNSACLIYKIGREEPFPIETNLYIFTERLSLDRLKQAIPSKDSQTGL